MAKDKTDKTKKKSPYIFRVFRGQVISSDFFARHWLPILIFIIVMMRLCRMRVRANGACS